MLEEFQEFIDFFIDKRLNGISLDLGKKDGKCKKLEIALLEVQDKFINKADEELQGLFVEYGDITNAEMVIIYREIYICAFKDALKAIGIFKTMKK
ncbi:hypothetical protein [Clostridium kluyveri]|uniref:Uncharacterized protein n=1 Tax=Clostridium kluyveri TaxID=1534 RepID=A0A1L5F9Z9_CLOKL|nr:hypothetical protein [Clostridium kluyveri]APM39848.1 hypothetical protein BS101_14455 [Clostridium kluyveri]